MELIQRSESLELVHPGGNWLIGADKGFSPVEVLSAAAAACSTYTFEELLAQKAIAFQLIRVRFDYEQDPFPPSPVSQIRIQFYLHCHREDCEKIKSVFMTIPENCPVLQSLHPQVKVNESVVFC